MSQLEPVFCSAKTKNLLKQLLPSPPLTLLFVGPPGSGKSHTALLFGRELIGCYKKDSLDLREFRPTGSGNIHTIDSIRDLIRESPLPPNESPFRVFILYEAHLISLAAMNALLKTLEEPHPHLVTILVTPHPEKLLSTVRSRCFKVPFYPLTEEELFHHLKNEHGDERARKIALLAAGSIDRADQLCAEKNSGEDQIFDLGTRILQGNYIDSKVLGEVDMHTLSSLFYFFRDLHLLKSRGPSRLLFFQDRIEVLQSYLSYPLPSLDTIGKRIHSLYEGLSRNIPLNHAIWTLGALPSEV